jgi:hypothetical protein
MLSALMLASCQTSADEVMSLGDAEPASAKTAKAENKTAGYVDPMVVAVAGSKKSAPATSAAGELPLYEPAPAKSPTMAAAYADIAEPPPEVMALQQQPPAADLGEVIMQPTGVDAGKNSLFSASPQAAAASIETPQADAATEDQVASSGSIVPSDMPTLKVNAMSKSLFSPATAQQQGIVDIPADALPLTEADAASQAIVASATGPVEEEGSPVLKRLSDPRPKRKMVAHRTVPALAADPQPAAPIAAVDPGEAAVPVSADTTQTAAVDPPKKKKFLPSLRELLKGGKAATTAKP